MASRFTPASISLEAISNVLGKTEFEKLFVSVVIPASREAAHLAGRRDASPSISGVSIRIQNRSSLAEDIPSFENVRSKDAVSGFR